MSLKSLLRRASGIVTAFALLASMMVMAGAARDGTYTCSLCGADIPYGQYGNDSTDSTYQQYYSVGDIDDLTNGNNFYFTNLDLYVACYKNSPICISCRENIITEYKANLREGTIVDSTTGSASVPVTVAREAANFSVTVPTTLPISVSADGTVTTATDAVIANNSGAPVAVTKVELTSQNNWTLAAYKPDILDLTVDTKQFGLQMYIGDKTVSTSNNGSSEILSDSLNAKITKGQKCAVTYNALFPAQTVAISDTQIANVVFTVGWA